MGMITYDQLHQKVVVGNGRIIFMKTMILDLAIDATLA